jgi:hypothetical protein
MGEFDPTTNLPTPEIKHLATDRFFEEAYGDRSIPIFTQQEIDCLALLIDRAVEIAPLTLHRSAVRFAPDPIFVLLQYATGWMAPRPLLK